MSVSEVVRMRNGKGFFVCSHFAFVPYSLSQTALVMTHVDLEESNTKLVSQNKDLTQKSQLCSVFETGLAELRTMLEAEIEEKEKLRAAFDDLSKFQKSTKLTWVPDKAATHCMECKNKFSRFGNGSKGHCRFCGRVFCRSCCTESAIPELNFPSKVKICKPCHSFRQKIAGEAKREAEDDDEEEPAPTKGGKSAASPAAGKGKQPAASILSYDSDELE